MTHLSLFSGVGGLDLAAEWAGFETAGQCEWADYQQKILQKHWPEVPKWRDIRTLTKESFYERTGLRTVDIISGGFPCQPFSVAGKQKGKGDDRYLWPEMLRVIRELTPRWVVGENVPGILRIAAADVVKDLEREGYDTVIFDFEAAAVGAPHRRERIAFVANRQSGPLENACCGGRSKPGVLSEQPWRADFERRSEAVAYAQMRREQREFTCRGEAWGFGCSSTCVSVCDAPTQGLQNRADEPVGESRQKQELKRPNRRPAQPGLGGVADGVPRWLDEPDIPRIARNIPNRVDRLKCLGNAVVPQQFFPIFKAIAEVEGIR